MTDDDSTILLTVGIPFYGRRTEAFELIDDLAELNGAPFEVVLINNCGDMGWFENVKTYAEAKIKRCTVYRNESNIGMDRNIDRCFRAGVGRYCLVVGDDDRIYPRELLNLLEYLTFSNAGIILLEYSYIDERSKVIRERVWDLKTPVTEATLDVTSFRSLIYKQGTKLGFVGSLIFRRDLYKQHANDRYKHTWFSHVAVGLSVIGSENKVSFYEQPVVRNRAESLLRTTWNQKVFEVIRGWWTMIRQWCHENPELLCWDEYWKHKEGVTFQYDSLLWMMSRRSEGLIAPANLRAIFSIFEITKISTRAKYIFVAVTPIALLIESKKLIRRFKG